MITSNGYLEKTYRDLYFRKRSIFIAANNYFHVGFSKEQKPREIRTLAEGKFLPGDIESDDEFRYV